MKKHNFYAGPSIMSQYTIDHCIDAIRDFAGTGLSILEISHRSKEFSAVIEKAEQLFKELLDIPEGYRVIFLGGGASLQFAMVPMNLMRTRAAYLDTGTWANKAIKEANPRPTTTPIFQKDMPCPKTLTISTSPPTTPSTAPKSVTTWTCRCDW